MEALESGNFDGFTEAIASLRSGIEDGDIDSVVRDGKTLLLLSIEGGRDVRFCRALLEAGARTGVYNDHVGAYPIHLAVMHDSLPHVQVRRANIHKLQKCLKHNISKTDEPELYVNC